MLNIKKGLALVLAAATALTFAPAASLEANAKTIIDWDQSTIELNAGGSKTFKIKDLLKLNGVDDKYGFEVSIADSSVAVIDKGSKTDTSQTLDTNSSITGSTVTATDGIGASYVGDFKSFKNANWSGSHGFAKDGDLTIDGVAEGTTTLTINLLDGVNHQTVQTETFSINVGRKIPYIELAKTSASATKVDSGDPKNSNNATSEEIAITSLGNLPTLSAGYEFKLAVKSSNESVAKASINGTDHGAAYSDFSATKIKIEYKGVGSTTVTLTLTQQKTDGSNSTELATKDINVTVDNATDSLAVEYDGNRDGVLDKTSVDASLGLAATTAQAATLVTNCGGTAADGAVSYITDSTGSKSYWQYVSADGKWYLRDSAYKYAPAIYLDTVTNKTADIKATDALGRNITFTATGWNGITVDNNGHVEILDTALNNQNYADNYIIVSVPYTGSGKKLISSLTIRIPVIVANKETTTLTVKKDNGETIAKTVGGDNLNGISSPDDLIAKGAVVYLSLKDKKTATVTSESNAGANYISGAVFDGSNLDCTKSSDIVSYSNGTLTALKPGKALVRIQARNSGSTYGSAYIYFVAEVTTKNANNKVTVDPSVINLTAGNKTATINAKSTYKSTLKYELVKAIGDKETVTSSDIKVDSAKGTVDYTSANTGVAYIRVSGTETAEAVAPDAAYVTVNFSSTKAASTLAVTSDKTVNLKVGDSSQIVASGSSVTYKSANENVATVDAGGNITAKGVGATVITVSSPEDATHMAGVDYVTVIVSSADVKTPAKVTGVKVTNKKGGYVTVTWNKQNQKNIKYYVKKTVGKKSSGKSVNGGKTTLVVKKGATVKVKVKAYVYDATGKKLVGAYSTTVTKKTDKK